MKSKVTIFDVLPVRAGNPQDKPVFLRSLMDLLGFGWIPALALVVGISMVGCKESDSDTTSGRDDVPTSSSDVASDRSTSTSEQNPATEKTPAPRSSNPPVNEANKSSTTMVKSPKKHTETNASKPAFQYDREELVKRCGEASLPQPPDLSAFDADSAILLRDQINVACQTGTAESIGQLGLMYSALAQSREDTNRAIECFEKAKALDPGSYKWPYYLARSFLNRASKVRARVELDRTLELNPEYAMAHGWLGSLALRDKRVDEALAQFQKYVELRPDDAYGYNGLAVVELEKGNLDGARELIDKALEVDPSNGWAYRISSRQYAEAGEPLLSARHNALGESYAMHPGALKRDPLALEQWRAVGATRVALSQLQILATAKDMISARLLSEALLTAHPDRFELQSGIAGFELFQGEVKEAIAMAESAKRLRPSSVPNAVTLARAYWADRRSDDALAEADRAVQLDQNSAIAHRVKGDILLDLDRLEEAQAEFMIDRKLNPENPGSASQIARTYQRLGDTGKSNEYYQKALLAASVGEFPTPMSALLHAGIAENYLRDGETKAAISQLKQAITADPKHTVIFSKLIEVLLRENLNDEALSYCVRAVNLNPEVLSFQFVHAEVLQRIGRSDQALAHAEKLCQTNPANPSVYLLYGKMLSNAGRQEAALTSLNGALQLDSKFEGAHVAITELYLAQGNYPKLIEAVQRGLEQVPSSVRLANTAAWVYATNRDELLRNPKEAIRLAELTCQETKRSVASCLDTLACAYAADGRFDDAKSTMAEAIALAQKNPAMAEEAGKYEARLVLFNEGKPYIDTEN